MIGKLRGPEKRTFEANYRTRTPQPWKQSTRTYKDWIFYGCILLNLYLISRFYSGYSPSWLSYYRNSEALTESCPVPLPTLFAQHPPSAKHPSLKLAKKAFEKTLNRFYREKKLDSVAVAIVTSSGSIYEGFHGPLRANDSSSYKVKVDRHSIYRIASISKMFASLETLILRDRGALNLDDPISKFIPELDYKTPHHSNADKQEDAITFRQLMSHMAGLGREHPDGDATRYWPQELGPKSPPGTNENPFPSTADLLQAIANRHLIMTPYEFPSYSNAGFALLGAANLAAAVAMEGSDAPHSYDDLVKRDILDKLGMSDSSFQVDDSNRDHLVIPSVASEEVDYYFRAYNSAGGQMSSLSDFVTFAQNLLNPSSNTSLLSPTTMNEWLKPIFNFWDGASSVGMPWEITRSRHAFGRTVDEYEKAGSLSSQFTAFTLIPSHSFAVVVLAASKEDHSPELRRLIMEYFLPAFDEALFEATEKNLAGAWVSNSEDADQIELHILASAGSLFATRYVINGTDALATLNNGQKVDRVPIWSLGNDEFRLRPTLKAAGDPGCSLGWVRLDAFTYMNGYAVNLLRLLPYESAPERNRLEIPAMKITLTRK